MPCAYTIQTLLLFKSLAHVFLEFGHFSLSLEKGMPKDICLPFVSVLCFF